MLKVRIAETPSQLEKGLMFVERMPFDEGMLFIFPRPQRLSFWGKNTLIPLDIAFVNRDQVIQKIATINPHSLSSVACDSPCVMALEVNAGYFEHNKIKVGHKLEMDMRSRISSLFTISSKSLLIPLHFREPHINEGHFAGVEKDSSSGSPKLRLSQLNDQPAVPVVKKRDEKTVGEPIGMPPKQQVEDPNNLPVLDTKTIGEKLEDSYDEVTGDENKPEGEQGSPTEQVGPGLLRKDISSPAEREIALNEEQPTQELPPVPEELKEQYPVFQSPFQAVQWAEENNEVVRVSYITRHGRQLTRDVEPHGQFHSKSTHRQILVTFDETIGDIRAFIISNIQDWSFVGRQFQKKFVVRG